MKSSFISDSFSFTNIKLHKVEEEDHSEDGDSQDKTPMIGNKNVRDQGFDDISHSATPNWTKPKANQIAELIEDHESKINNLENTYIND